MKNELGKLIQDFRKVEEDESKSRAKYTKEWQNWIDFFKDDRKSNLFGKTEEAVHKKAISSRDENIRLTDSFNLTRQNLFEDQFPASIKSFTSINTTVAAQIEELGILTQCVSEVAKLFHLHYYDSMFHYTTCIFLLL